MWHEAIEHVVGCWTERRVRRSRASTGRCRTGACSPKPLQQPHPPIWGATTSDDGHRQVGELGLGLCSFAVGVSPEEVKKKIDIYREAVQKCTQPIGKFVNNQRRDVHDGGAARRRKDEARGRSPASRSSGTRRSAPARSRRSPSGWRSASRTLGNYGYAADMRQAPTTASLDLLSLEYLVDTGACVLGTPDQCVELCKRYEAAGVDLLLCLVNPLKIAHDAVMQTIELMGKTSSPSSGRSDHDGSDQARYARPEPPCWKRKRRPSMRLAASRSPSWSASTGPGEEVALAEVAAELLQGLELLAAARCPRRRCARRAAARAR